LDVLRFFAFLGVFLFHAYVGTRAVQDGPRWIAFANHLNYAGVFGVDLFFVLSAYLITELLLREKRQFGKLNIQAFYLRRILRIWPLYFFAIGLGLIPFFNRDHAFTSRYATAFLLLAGNWSIVAWGWPAGYTVVSPLWTVSIEEQFYLLWPPIVRKISAASLAYVAIAMLVLASTMRAVMVAIHAGPFSIWCNTLCRLDPIALGILVAVVLRGRIPNFSIGTRLGLLLGGTLPVVLVANFWNIVSPKSLEWIPNLLGFPIVAVGCTLILLATLGISVQPRRALVYLGRISYGLYVYHFMAASITASFLIHGPITHFRWLLLRKCVALAVTVLLASVSYALLEKPFLNLKKRFELVGSRPI
jgi:peptidoglycan/LPS O-acetylase OafA/YrhL